MISLNLLWAALDDADDVLGEVNTTAGNCHALIVQLADGGELLATEESGPLPDADCPMDDIYVGQYDADHEWIREIYLGTSVREAARAITETVRRVRTESRGGA